MRGLVGAQEAEAVVFPAVLPAAIVGLLDGAADAAVSKAASAKDLGACTCGGGVPRDDWLCTSCVSSCEPQLR